MNAMEAMGATPPGKRLITIKTSTMQSGWIEARISDCGTGIAPEHENLVQEPFFTTKASGLGLGLSICTTIMRSHGGDLQIGNGPNGGAEVLLTLPAPLPENETASN
jgi:C4-dicarboxylate-specific signal transduction histidine kinase